MPFLNPQLEEAPCRGNRDPLLAPRLKNEYIYTLTPRPGIHGLL